MISTDFAGGSEPHTTSKLGTGVAGTDRLLLAERSLPLLLDCLPVGVV